MGTGDLWKYGGWGVEATRLCKLRQRKRSWSRLNSLLSAPPEFDYLKRAKDRRESTCTAACSAGCALFQVWKAATCHSQQGTRAGALDVVANCVVPTSKTCSWLLICSRSFIATRVCRSTARALVGCCLFFLLGVSLAESIETRDKGIEWCLFFQLNPIFWERYLTFEKPEEAHVAIQVASCFFGVPSKSPCKFGSRGSWWICSGWTHSARKLRNYQVPGNVFLDWTFIWKLKTGA